MSKRFVIKNYKLALLALILFCAFVGLGNWQLNRAQEKRNLLAAFASRTLQPPYAASSLKDDQDLRYYRASLRGTFDNAHTFLLDNKTYQGQVGYEVYTPFIVQGLSKAILIDRGFIPLVNHRRDNLPQIKSDTSQMTLLGMLNTPPTYFAFGKMLETQAMQNPLRVQYINLGELTKQLPYPLFAYILTISPQSPMAYATEWRAIITMSPEKHTGYAVQWFALALTLLILFVALNLEEKNNL